MTEIYKLVTLNYSEQAQIVVRADTDEEAAEAVLETFRDVPDVRVVAIEEATEAMIAEVKSRQAEQETDRTLN